MKKRGIGPRVHVSRAPIDVPLSNVASRHSVVRQPLKTGLKMEFKRLRVGFRSWIRPRKFHSTAGNPSVCIRASIPTEDHLATPKSMSWKCEKCGELNDSIAHRACWKCKKPRFGPDPVEIPCSTTMEIPGRLVLESKGLVFGEAILGANIFRDLLAGVRDIVGGRSGAYESKLQEGRDVALTEMMQEARAIGADAIIGVDVDYETVGQSMMMVCASGTAVTLQKTS